MAYAGGASRDTKRQRASARTADRRRTADGEGVDTQRVGAVGVRGAGGRHVNGVDFDHAEDAEGEHGCGEGTEVHAVSAGQREVR